ncbi:hypothetical protein B8V81_3550 [Paenibacillus pasadenensis]|uniref:Uncharacterized protein n=1 Tax=Paenibacillus pasadenensis TaxID=217090 RepID=A0A2N5N4A7_9BACL|nr:hypothetical protein B8V81_3550 [Paenibacillus pasadenensis]
MNEKKAVPERLGDSLFLPCLPARSSGVASRPTPPGSDQVVMP